MHDLSRVMKDHFSGCFRLMMMVVVLTDRRLQWMSSFSAPASRMNVWTVCVHPIIIIIRPAIKMNLRNMKNIKLSKRKCVPAMLLKIVPRHVNMRGTAWLHTFHIPSRSLSSSHETFRTWEKRWHDGLRFRFSELRSETKRATAWYESWQTDSRPAVLIHTDMCISLTDQNDFLHRSTTHRLRLARPRTHRSERMRFADHTHITFIKTNVWFSPEVDGHLRPPPLPLEWEQDSSGRPPPTSHSPENREEVSVEREEDASQENTHDITRFSMTTLTDLKARAGAGNEPVSDKYLSHEKFFTSGYPTARTRREKERKREKHWWWSSNKTKS